MVFGELTNSFVLGLLTPLTAACVLPLYPGFLSYLSKRFSGEESRKTFALFGVLVVLGVISFMLATGILFSAILQVSLTSVIEVVSPLAFGFLAVVSIVMILDLDFQSRIPSYQGPSTGNTFIDAFGFGFFFGGIVIPCNPGFITLFLARASLFRTPASSLLNFFLFGLGIGFPLLVFSVASSGKSQQVIQFLKKHDSKINRGTGLVMLLVSIYYLVCVFGLGGAFGAEICGLFKLVLGVV